MILFPPLPCSTPPQLQLRKMYKINSRTLVHAQFTVDFILFSTLIFYLCIHVHEKNPTRNNQTTQGASQFILGNEFE